MTMRLKNHKQHAFLTVAILSLALGLVSSCKKSGGSGDAPLPVENTQGPEGEGQDEGGAEISLDLQGCDQLQLTASGDFRDLSLTRIVKLNRQALASYPVEDIPAIIRASCDS